MKGFLDYVHGDSLLHRISPLTKLLLAILLCISCFTANSMAYLIILIGVSLGAGALGGIFPRTFKTFISLLKFMSIIWLLQILFISDGNTLVPLLFGLKITDQGLYFSTMICLRLIGATLPLTIMLSLTQMSDLTQSMVDKLGIPYRYAFSLTTAIRFIPVLANDMGDIIEAQKARGVELDGNIFKKIKLMLPLCVPLLISSVKRIESSAISAELRGFHLRQKNNSFKQHKFKLQDAAFMVMGVVLLCGSLII